MRTGFALNAETWVQLNMDNMKRHVDRNFDNIQLIPFYLLTYAICSSDFDNRSTSRCSVSMKASS